MLTRPTVTLVPTDPATWPPIPDKEIADRWLAACKAADRTIRPVPPEVNVGHYIRVQLNIRTGELTAHAHDWRTGRVSAFDPAVTLMMPNGGPHQWFTVPDQMCWVVDAGMHVKEFPLFGAAAADQLIADLRDTAQWLIDSLVEIPGTDEWDWSPAACSATLHIDRRCSRAQTLPTTQCFPRFVACDDALAYVPDLVKPRWADASDKTLDNDAENLTRFALHWHPELYDLAGLPRSADVDEQPELYVWAGIVGARAHLYRYRAEQAAGRTPLDAWRWFTRPENSLVGRVHAGHTDDELAELAAREQDKATTEGIKLIGTVAVMAKHRAGARAQLVDELDALGAAVDRAEDAARLARLRRTARLTEILSWGDPNYDNNADLGRRAHCTGEAVRQLRGGLTERPILSQNEPHGAAQ